LASVGYYVMLPNLYYRHGIMERGPAPTDPNDPMRAKLRGIMDSVTIPLVMSDMEALIAFADGQPDASKCKMGCVGYCMSGRFAINAAVRFPRVVAAASLHGTHLASDDPDSPHRVATRTKAAMYVGYAEDDEFVPLPMVEEFKRAVAGCTNIEVECYAGANHAFVFPSRPSYNKAYTERHWERLFALFGRQLKSN
jgi:carboxymethylenebutenolidase